MDLQKISSEATSVEDLVFCRGSLWHHELSYIAPELQDFLHVFSQVCADASKDSGHEDLYSKHMFFVCPTKGLHEKWILQGTAWCQQFVQLYVWEPASHQRKITEHYLDKVIPSSSGIASWSGASPHMTSNILPDIQLHLWSVGQGSHEFGIDGWGSSMLPPTHIKHDWECQHTNQLPWPLHVSKGWRPSEYLLKLPRYDTQWHRQSQSSTGTFSRMRRPRSLCC